MTEETRGRDGKGRFTPGNSFSNGRVPGAKGKASRLSLIGQAEFLQKGIDFLPELMEFLQSRVKNDACLTSAKLILDKAFPNSDAAGVVLNEKLAELEAELTRCHELLDEQARTIEALHKPRLVR